MISFRNLKLNTNNTNKISFLVKTTLNEPLEIIRQEHCLKNRMQSRCCDQKNYNHL